MKKILFPTDFSETANNALLYALSLAESQDATVYVLHVYELPIINGGISAGLVQNVYDTVKFGQFENFKDNIPQLRKIAEDNGFGHIPLKFILEEGNFLYIMRETIIEEKIDYVVMGTTGYSDIEKKIFGTNTINAITSLKAPILSVPNHIKFDGIKKIGFTTIFNDNDKEALYYLIEVANRHSARVQCLHVSKDGKYDDTALENWKDEFKDEPVDFIIKVNPEPVNAVLEFIEEAELDLLTVISRNKGFFDKLFAPSVSKKIAAKNSVPLFVFHSK
jgi:nucleotide-binding universal stress UspA family protein